MTISPGNSRSIAQESGEIWTAQPLLQPISFKSDRLLGGGITERDGAHAILSNAQTGFATGLDKLCAASKKYDYRNLTTILMMTSRANAKSSTYIHRGDEIPLLAARVSSSLRVSLNFASLHERAIKSATQHRTTMIIAHRLSTVRRAVADRASSRFSIRRLLRRLCRTVLEIFSVEAK